MIKAIILIALLLVSPPVFAQGILTPRIIVDSPTITVTTATADTTATPSTGTHELIVSWTAGTVSGSYTGCTAQAKTAIDGTNYLPIGPAMAVTITTGTKTNWTITEGPTGTASTAAAQAFGQLTKFSLACGAYGTSAPMTVTAIYVPSDANSDGAQPYHLISLASTNATSVKAAPGYVYSLLVVNVNAATRYLKLYDTASAPNCASATGVVFGAPVPASATGAGFVYAVRVGKTFVNGIGFCMTATSTDTANDAVGAGDLFLNMDFK